MEWPRDGSSKCPAGKLNKHRKDVALGAGGTAQSWGAQVSLCMARSGFFPSKTAPDLGLDCMMARTNFIHTHTYTHTHTHTHTVAPSLSFGIWDLVPCPGIKPMPPALAVESLSYWTTSKVSKASL